MQLLFNATYTSIPAHCMIWVLKIKVSNEWLVHWLSTLTFSFGIENSLLNYIRLTMWSQIRKLNQVEKYKTVTLDVFSEILLDIC